MSEENLGMLQQQGSQIADEQHHTFTHLQLGEQGDVQTQGSGEKNLEFVHISKTGGSAIVASAAIHNIMWSECHYWTIPNLGCDNPDWEYPTKELESTPAGLIYQGFPWHAPPHWNVPNILEGSDTFVVVRNPVRTYLLI